MINKKNLQKLKQWDINDLKLLLQLLTDNTNEELIEKVTEIIKRRTVIDDKDKTLNQKMTIELMLELNIISEIEYNVYKELKVRNIDDLKALNLDELKGVIPHWIIENMESHRKSLDFSNHQIDRKNKK